MTDSQNLTATNRRCSMRTVSSSNIWMKWTLKKAHLYKQTPKCWEMWHTHLDKCFVCCMGICSTYALQPLLYNTFVWQIF